MATKPPENTSKRYFWNSNARTHVGAIIGFLCMAQWFGMTISGILVMLIIRMANIDKETAFYLFWAGALTAVGVALPFYLVMLNSYIRLIESQVINPPTGNEKVFREVYYQTANGYVLDKNASRVGGVSTGVDTSNRQG